MMVSAWVPLAPDLTFTRARVTSSCLAELFVIFTVTLMPTCPAWVPAAFLDGVNRTTPITLASTLSSHFTPWSAPNAIVPEVLVPPPPLLPVVGPVPPVLPVAGVPPVVELADGLLLLLARIAATAIPPPQSTTAITATRVMIRAVFFFGPCGGAGMYPVWGEPAGGAPHVREPGPEGGGAGRGGGGGEGRAGVGEPD